MNRVVLVASVLLCLAGLAVAAQGRMETPNPYLGKVRHVELYSYKADTPEETQADIARRSRALIGQIDLIRDLEWGPALGQGPATQGYTHCIIMTFDSMEDVKAYAAHPAHQEFLGLARPHLEQLLVMDYIAQE